MDLCNHGALNICINVFGKCFMACDQRLFISIVKESILCQTIEIGCYYHVIVRFGKNLRKRIITEARLTPLHYLLHIAMTILLDPFKTQSVKIEIVFTIGIIPVLEQIFWIMLYLSFSFQSRCKRNSIFFAAFLINC